jgi:hypothetical protein
MRTAAWVGGAVGLALIGTGSYYGLRALNNRSESDASCRDDGYCTKEGVALNNEAYESARVCNVLLGSGIILTGLSAFVLLRFQEHASPRSDAAAKRGLTPTIAIGAGSEGIDAKVRVRW